MELDVKSHTQFINMEQEARPSLSHLSSLLQPLRIRFEPRMGRDQAAANPGSMARPLLVPSLLSPEAARLGKAQPWINICPGFWVPMYNSRKRREDREKERRDWT